MPYKDAEKQKAFQKQHYQNNKKDYCNRSQQQRAKNKAWLDDQKRGPCYDCGNSYPPCAMDFHHLNKTAKKDSVSIMIAKKGRQSVIEEIKKCVLLCAVCHRIREHVD